MLELFHVTPKSNLESILTNGLIPQIGERSKEMEIEPLVCLFASYEDCENALCNWLGESFDELEEELITLKVVLPNTVRIEQTTEWEYVSKQTIAPCFISFFKNEG